jgi:hypothetical protein
MLSVVQDVLDALPLAGAFWLTLLIHEAGHRQVIGSCRAWLQATECANLPRVAAQCNSIDSKRMTLSAAHQLSQVVPGHTDGRSNAHVILTNTTSAWCSEYLSCRRVDRAWSTAFIVASSAFDSPTV